MDVIWAFKMILLNKLRLLVHHIQQEQVLEMFQKVNLKIVKLTKKIVISEQIYGDLQM